MRKEVFFVAVFFLQMFFCRDVYSQAKVDDKDTLHIGYGQKDIIDVLLKVFHPNKKHRRKRNSHEVSFSLFPSTSSDAGNGRAFVTSFSAAVYLGNRDSTNISTMYFTPYTSFTGKYSFPVRLNIWTNNNKWNITADWRLMLYPQYTYGLGSYSKTANADLIDNNYLRMYQTLSRKIYGHFVMGAGIQLDYHYNIHENWHHDYPSEFSQYPGTYRNNSTSVGYSLLGLYDSRKNSVNPWQGFYATLLYRINPKFMGGDYFWQSTYIDMRKYISFHPHKQRVLAMWGFYQQVISGTAPYLDLPSSGWDPTGTSSRCYNTGRYRGTGMIYLESEFRFDITKNGLFGMVVFAQMFSMQEYTNNSYSHLIPGAGSGVRLKFNKNSRTNLGFDCGFGINSWNFNITLGEYF